MRIDLNADLGEGFGAWQMGDDAAMMEIVTTVNVACGLHAGDPLIMRQTVAAARDAGIAVGAHPGYADLAGFGRRHLPGVTEAEVERLVAYQTGALLGIAALEGHPVTHVKTHGALGNAANDDDGIAMAVGRAIRAVDPALAYMVMPGTPTERAAETLGLRPIREIYADRSYSDTFNLTPRGQPGAMIHDADEAVVRVRSIIENRRITSLSGRTLSVDVDTVCVHGDSPGAVAMARALRAGLEAAGIQVRPTLSE